MNLHARAIDRYRFDLDPDELLALHLFEQAIEHTRLGPAIHARIDRVPVAKARGQSAPFATVLRHIEDGVDHLKTTNRDIASLYREEWLDAAELSGCDFHAAQYTK
jgi:hypothetical protein